jgi:hypothetical protein
MKKGRRRVTVVRAPTHKWVSLELSSKPLSTLSAMQLKRAYEKDKQVYLIVIKPIDDPADKPVNNNSGLPRSASNYMATDITDPSGKERRVSGLVEDFSDMFQDPLPPRLPPERDEGHSIPAEPVQRWTRYRCSLAIHVRKPWIAF